VYVRLRVFVCVCVHRVLAGRMCVCVCVCVCALFSGPYSAFMQCAEGSCVRSVYVCVCVCIYMCVCLCVCVCVCVCVCGAVRFHDRGCDGFVWMDADIANLL